MVVCFTNSCCDKPSIQQRIPIGLQQTMEFKIQSLHGGENPVGLQCPLRIWQLLTNTPSNILVSVVSADDPKTQVWGILGDEADGHEITNFHYLFMINGVGNATIRISFAHEPPQETNVFLIVKRSWQPYP
jgi:hypothetical protein